MSGDSGWNAVIHHPSELELQNWNWDENDDEGERELPSTVDMDAIKGGGSWDPATARNDTDSVDSEEDSDSDEDSSGGTEGSCSYSDSESENDSSAEEDCADTGSNTDCSSENSEQTFSIRETNFEQGALKLKISMKAQKKEEVDKTKCEKPRRLPARNPKGPNNNSAKSGEYATDDSNSSGTPSAANSQEQTSQQAASGLGSATTTATTSATTTTTTSTTTTSSASTTSASSTTTSTVPSTQPQSQQQPLQEINQEDLAAILPDQEHEDAPFDGFEDSESGRMVSKAIERMSLGADSDSSEATDANPVPVYSSTLLQQFVEKTALLSEPRKRRSKLVKKPADAEYACVSNVSPDSGIQSVDNSPLHLAASPTSQLAASQSPVQTSAPTKPAVNVDRVLYPPKRKPGRPAKMVSTQPRGPGRPRLRPEVVEKIEKIERSVEQQPAPNNVRPKKAEPADTKSTKNNIHEITAKATTNVTANKNPQPSPNKSKRFRDKKSTRTAHESDETKSEDKPRTENRQADDTSETRSCCEQMTKKSNQSRDRSAERETSKKSKEKLGNSNKASAPIVAHKTSRREQTQAQHQQEERCTSNGRKSTKENRATEVTSTLGKKVFASKKCGQATITTGTTTTATMTTTTTTTVATGARRVLKENKSSKKSAGRDSETNVVGVQTVISLPVVSPLKSENIEIDAYKCEKTLQITHNNRPISHHHHHNHRHHHHHKHRRRVIVPPKRPIKINPVVSEELEKLIDEFARSCNLGRNNSSIVHSELPQIFRVKKMIKKRKGSDGNASEEQKLKRRLKKEKLPANGDSKSGQNNSSNSNSNEQRLPLKKRHYHVSSPHSSQSSSASGNEISSNETNATDNHIEEAIEATITRYSENLGNNNQRENVPVTPKKRHRDTEVTSVEAPINESCESADEKPANRLEIQPRRKKKIVKDLRVTVTKLSSENHVANDKSDKIEAHPNEIKSPKSHPEKLLKSDKSSAAKSDKAQPPKTDKSSLVKSDKALTEKSIKMDKVVVELAEKALDSAATTLENSRDKNNAESCDTKPTIVKIPDTRDKRNDPSARVPSPVRSSITATILTKKKIRRRKPINRTGFPTLKKKKKKIPPVEHVENGDDEGKLKVIRRTDAIEKSIVTEMKVSNDDKDVLTESEIQAVIPIVKETSTEHQTLEKVDEKITYKDYDECNDPPILEEDASRINHCDGTGHSRSSGKLRVRKDLVECDGSRPCDKLCPVKFEKIQDSRMYDENATLEESLERYNQSQRVAELSVENVKKLDRASNNDPSNVKLEISACLNNNHKRRRGSTSPCNVTLRNIKRLRSAGYDTESDALPSSDVASDETEIGKQLGSTQIKRKQPRWKKRYLQAGLFSDYYKEDEPRRVTNSENSAGKNKMIYDSAEHPHGLLPPPYHCGKFLRQRKIHFQLPYDLWWLHTHSRLPGRDLVPSWNYRKIRTNIYFDVKPTTLYEAQSCECNPESGCGDECINRMVFSECSPHFCPCSERCSNQKIQRHEWAPGLQRFMTDCKGWGIRTKDSIKMGDFILEYVGEVVSEREFKSRMATRYANDTHHYCLHLDGGLVIDGHRMGGDGRFVNHSCEPNCEMQKWSVHGLPRMALFASRNIIPGEELTYDYNFALFNPSEGQQCRCGSEVCRGVIGGKSQRVARCLPITPAQVDTTERRSVGRPRKNVRKSIIVQSSNSKGLCKTRKIGDSAIIHAPSIKPMSHQQRCFAQQHHCFLLRNLEKVRRLKAPTSNSLQAQSGKGKDKLPQTLKEKNLVDSKTQSDAFYSQLTALNNVTCRTVRTRRLAQAQDDPEVNKTAKLAKVLKNLYDVVATANDENCQLLCSPFVSLPPKRKLPEYYEKIVDPIDLTMIEQAVSTGQYKLAEQFDQDMIKLFDNNVKFFGRTSELGIAAARLRKLYLGSKADFIEAITEATGSPPAHGFLPPQGSTAGEEDVIRCICGLHRDEGLMIQCERCLVWQHCDCVKADTSAESYLCERCQPRKVDLEIPLEGEEEEEGKKQYVTLLRGDLQLRQGDTVYVLRDTPEKHTYKTIQKPDYEEMDIFRIERLWKNAQGERFVFGHHYLRPHETYHEPTRKFYENEVVCAPLYEAVPCDLVAERCWVLDPNTYCKGRPVCSTPEHTYVCEYRVDRAARLFTKVARARHQVCVKPYAFEVFPERIKHYRTYLPHSLEGVELGSSKVSKDKKKPPTQEVENNSAGDVTETTKINGKDQSKSFSSRTRRRSCDTSVVTTFAVSSAQKDTQRKRLNTILLSLLQRMPNKKDPLDLSFLLDRNRRNRKRTGNLNP